MSANCQKCGSRGLSVAAMNYKESQEIDKDGRFQGGGVGIGTGGLGAMVGGGTYSEKDEIYSKRAKEFAPPEAHYEPVFNKFFMALAFGFLFVVGIPFMRYLTSFSSPNTEIPPFNILSTAFNSHWAIILFPIIGIIGFLFYLKGSIDDVEESDRLEKEETPKILARYREIFYCENCHLLFDEKNNIKDGSRIGFEAMMQIPADPESLKLLQG